MEANPHNNFNKFRNKEVIINPISGKVKQFPAIKNQKVYISGKMTGVDNHNFEKFEKAEKLLTKLGAFVENPHKFEENKTLEMWQDFMKNDIKRLISCQFVAILDDWWDSKGAKLEILIAQQLGIKIFHAMTLEWFDFGSAPKFYPKIEGSIIV